MTCEQTDVPSRIRLFIKHSSGNMQMRKDTKWLLHILQKGLAGHFFLSSANFLIMALDSVLCCILYSDTWLGELCEWGRVNGCAYVMLTVVGGADLLLLEKDKEEEEAEGAADDAETGESSCIRPLLSKTLRSNTQQSVSRWKLGVEPSLLM